MKKILALLLAGCMAMALCACGTPAEDTSGDADSSGAWTYYDTTIRLAVERDSRDVLRTWTFRSALDQENTGEDYIQALWAEAEAALSRGEGLETHDVSPAIFWDTVQGELYAVSFQPVQRIDPEPEEDDGAQMFPLE